MIPKLYVVFAFALFYMFSIMVDGLNKKHREQILLFICMAIALFVGFRNPELWDDTGGYKEDFENAKDLFSFSWDDPIYGYVEKGFHFLAVLCKTITNSSEIYLTIISCLSIFFLYRSLQKYSILPMLGLCIYMSRFLVGRNMMQIRACLAIVIIIYFTAFIKEKKWWKYLLVLIISYQLHHSAIVAAPLLILSMCNYRISRTQIYIGLFISFVVAGWYGGVIKNFVNNSQYIMDMASSYVEEGSSKAFSNDLTNPVIWFQTIILILFTYNEKQLSKLSSYYYLYRNAYFISTCLLIVMCQYAVVAGRTSTLFATYECMMLPLLVEMLKKRWNILMYLIIGIGLIVLFYLNWKPAYIWVD